MPVTIRPYQEGDAHHIAELYNRYLDSPSQVVGKITGEVLEHELALRNMATVLVAVDDGRLVGTFGLLRNSGQRYARPGEIFTSKFFVAPAYRNGVLSGRLFTEAIEWMMRSGHLVLRLTVNPANAAVFRLYRRLGCVSVGEPAAGEDGYIELHNYIPLVLRSVIADLDSEARAALLRLNSFGNVTDSRDDELRSDVHLVDGTRTVDYCVNLGEYRLTASVDVDRGRVREARLTGPGGGYRPLRVEEPPYRLEEPRDAGSHRFTSGELVCEVDGRDGTVQVLAPGHHGPVFVSTWPGSRADRSSGWWDSEPRHLDITPAENGVRVAERCGDDETVCTVTFTEGVLDQDFTFTSRPGRIFHTIGLRQGTLTLSDPGRGAEQRYPLGLGLGLVDATDLAAAGHAPAAGSTLTWNGPATRIDVPVRQPIRFIHSCLIERELEPSPDGVVRLRTVLQPGPAPAPALRTVERNTSAESDRRIEMDASAAGVVSWHEGATKVLRTPGARPRVFGRNPRWSAGMWVTAERGRFSRNSGLGWGVRSASAWEKKHPLGLFAPEERISWELSLPDGSDQPIRADVQAPGAAEEIVLWITPNTPTHTTVVFDSAGTRWELSSSEFQQVWTSTASVLLSDGSWLDCRPAPGATDEAEIVLRTTASGLLIGCVSAAQKSHGAESSWHLAVSRQPGI